MAGIATCALRGFSKSLSVNGSRGPTGGHRGCVATGVHLPDALIGATILATLCASLPPAFAGAARASHAAGDMTWSTLLAAQKIEELRSLPYHDADRLVWIASLNQTRSQYSKSSGWDFNTWRQRTSVFAAVEAYWDRPFTITGTQHPEALVGWQFTPTLFATLRVPAVSPDACPQCAQGVPAVKPGSRKQ